MTRETIFEAMTDIKDEYVEEMRTYPLPKRYPAGKRTAGNKTWRKPALFAAAAAVVLLFGITVLPGLLPKYGNSGGGSGGHDGGSTFLSYAGPVFPMSIAEEGTQLTAERTLTYDFSPWSSGWISAGQRLDVLVSDEYRITNDSEEDKTVTLRYPFAGSFRDLAEIMPILTADGNDLTPVLTAGPYSGSFISAAGSGEPDETLNLSMPDSWEVYRYLFEEAGYQEESFRTADEDALDSIPVIVYRVVEYGTESRQENGLDGGWDSASTLALEYSLDYENTAVLSFGFDGSEMDYDAGFGRRSFFIPSPGDTGYGRSRYLIVLGEDIRDLRVQGYKNGGCKKGEELEGFTGSVNRTESSLGEIVRQAAGEYADLYRKDRDWMNEETKQLWTDEICRMASAYSPIGTDSARRYEGGMLDLLISDAESADRVFYVESAVTVPAHGSIDVSATFLKQPSFDFYCAYTENQGIYGYDMVTKLGSRLDFTAMNARVINTESIEIVRNNYGFDLDAGIMEKQLDTDVPHYYLEVKEKQQVH